MVRFASIVATVREFADWVGVEEFNCASSPPIVTKFPSVDRLRYESNTVLLRDVSIGELPNDGKAKISVGDWLTPRAFADMTLTGAAVVTVAVAPMLPT